MNERAELEASLSPAIDSGWVEPLARYGAMVLEANRRFNLTGAKSVEALCPHILDSLTVVPFLDGSLVDIGSGAGLPAIPAAIVSGFPVTLIEATLRKARFLEGALQAFGLAGRVVAKRAEVAAHDPDLREAFCCGTARAVSSAPTVAELLVPLLAPGGLGILQRGALSKRERDALGDAALMLGAGVEQSLGLKDGRQIVLLRKRSATPLRFPRRTGVPEKRPLCL